MFIRSDGRNKESLRPIKIIPNFLKNADGSVLIQWGDTKVICAATLENHIPRFLKGSGTGWLTAEYSMIPCAGDTRSIREVQRGKQSGRTQEIQRLIGRSLRAAIDLSLIGEKTIQIDCDVIQADGGTRVASITGSMVALKLAIDKYLKRGILEKNPIKNFVAAVSIGKVNSNILLDLKYDEDSKAEVDMNVVMDEQGNFIEVQATGEESTFTLEELNQMLKIASDAIRKIIKMQKSIFKSKN